MQPSGSSGSVKSLVLREEVEPALQPAGVLATELASLFQVKEELDTAAKPVDKDVQVGGGKSVNHVSLL